MSKYANPNEWQSIQNKFYDTESRNEAIILLKSLSCTSDSNNLASAFSMLTSKKMDSSFVVPFLTFLSEIHVEETFQFFQSNFKFFSSNFQSDLESIVFSLTHRFSTGELLDNFLNFLDQHRIVKTRTILQTISLIQSNILVRNNYSSSLEEWINNFLSS